MSANFMRPSWQKVLADLWINKTRTLLVVASITVGVFAIGALSSNSVILSEDIGVSYASAQPANIEVVTDPFDEDLVKTVENIPGVLDAEGRHMLTVRASLDGKSWQTLDIVAAEDFREAKINLLTSGEGTMVPEDRQLMVREDILNSTGYHPGDELLVQLADGTIRRMPVVGAVGDQYAAGNFALPPRGYVTLKTAEWLGGYEFFNRLYVRVEEGDNEAAIQAISNKVEDKVEESGRTVYRKNTNKTTEHPLEATVLAINGVLAAIGILIVFLSSSLIFNTLNALLTQHRRQIGVMKLIGGRSVQISGMYMALIFIYGLLAALIAVPLGVVAGYRLSTFLAQRLSIEIQGFRVAPIAILLQVLLAFAVPLIAGYFPVKRGSRTSVRRAISEENPAEQGVGEGFIDRLGMRLSWLSRPLLLSIRNTFRRKGRLALTLFTLTMAGAIFIAVFNVRDSINSFMDLLGQYYLSDVMVTLNEPARKEQVEHELEQIPGVERVESWGIARAEILDDADGIVTTLVLFLPPDDTELLDPDLVAGRWLEPDDEKVLVVADSIWSEYPDFQIGDTLRIEFSGRRDEEWPVVGIFRFVDNVGDNVLGYADYDTVSRLTNSAGKASTFRIVAQEQTLESQKALSQVVDQYLRERGYSINNVEAGKVTRQQQTQSMSIIVVFLLIMAVLTAVVGSIGLMGTMGMNVLERTREIGVMRAIGAVDREIVKSVVVEGLMIGLISFAAACVISIPISFILLRIISEALVGTVMDLQITPAGFTIWLVTVVVLSMVASLWPARGASRLTIREVLAYE
ncbi:MAG: ABC transporter permease [Candidatus Promineifilaceae bacterium]